MSAPAVGVTCALEQARWVVWDQQALVLPRSYATAIQQAGAVALLLSPDEAACEDPDRILDRLDGLVISGGADVDPAFYGAPAHPETRGTGPERDRFEIALVRRAIERDMPLLGVCRGMHVINVALGGTLDQHLPDSVGHEHHRHTPGSFSDHEVLLESGSHAAALTGRERLAVKSHHHQGLDALGEGVVATGWAVGDEIVEAIELPGRRFAVGVLWHPEEDEASGVLRRFVTDTVPDRAGALG